VAAVQRGECDDLLLELCATRDKRAPYAACQCASTTRFGSARRVWRELLRKEGIDVLLPADMFDPELTGNKHSSLRSEGCCMAKNEVLPAYLSSPNLSWQVGQHGKES
jgi:hypothetical protein